MVGTRPVGLRQRGQRSVLRFLAAVAGLLAVAPVAGAASLHQGLSRVTLGSGVAQTISRRCGACHSPEFSLWVRHPHSHFLIDPAVDPRLIDARWGEAVAGWSDHVAGRFQRDDVALAYGVLQIQVYFRKHPDGHRLLPAQWSREEQRWDPLHGELQAVLAGGTTWEEGCAGCHTTGFNPGDNSFVEANAACGACHGAVDAHLESAGIEPILRPSALEPQRRAEICGACHSRGRDRGTGRPYPVGFTPGTPLADRFELASPVPGETTPFYWPDGTERLPFMEFQGFLQSGHSRAGLSCTTCHLPHGSDQPRGLRRKTADLCSGCHGDAVERSPAHAAHPKGDATCVDCHMAVSNPGPGQHQVRTHTFRFLEPDRAAATGMPSSCTVSCHRERGAPWAVEVLRSWDRP